MSFWELLLNSRVVANLVWAGLIIVVVCFFRKPIIERIIGIKELKWRDWALKFTARSAMSMRKTIPREESEKFIAYELGTNISFISFLIETGAYIRDIAGFMSITEGYMRTLRLEKHAKAFENLRITLPSREKLQDDEKQTLLGEIWEIQEDIRFDL